MRFLGNFFIEPTDNPLVDNGKDCSMPQIFEFAAESLLEPPSFPPKYYFAEMERVYKEICKEDPSNPSVQFQLLRGKYTAQGRQMYSATSTPAFYRFARTFNRFANSYYNDIVRINTLISIVASISLHLSHHHPLAADNFLEVNDVIRRENLRSLSPDSLREWLEKRQIELDEERQKIRKKFRPWLIDNGCPPPTNEIIEAGETVRESLDLKDSVGVPIYQTSGPKKIASLKQQIDSLSQPRKSFWSFAPHLSFKRRKELDGEIAFLETYISQETLEAVENNFKRVEGLIKDYSEEPSVADKIKAGAILLVSALGIAGFASIGSGAAVVETTTGGGTATGTTGAATTGKLLLAGAVANDNAWALAASFLAYIGIKKR